MHQIHLKYALFFILGFLFASLLYNYSVSFPQKEDFYSLLSSARSHIYISVYSFTDTEIAKILVKKYRSGIDVKVVVDPSSYENKAVSYLVSNGVPVRIHSPGKMHAKLMLVDNNLIIGSHNYTFSAFNTNTELSLMLNFLFYLPIHEAETWFQDLWKNSSIP